jgi:hypothetical protein
MATSKIFGLRLFREIVSVYIKDRKQTDDSKIDVKIPNEFFLLEAQKFLDTIGIIKKLNEYHRISNLLRAKTKAKANREIENDGLTLSLVLIVQHFTFQSIINPLITFRDI